MTKARSIFTEVIKDFSFVKKQLLYIVVIFSTAAGLIVYNLKFIELEREITQLNQQKNYLQLEQVELKKELAKLSAPNRISKLAKKRLKMEKVNMENVKFIEYK